MSDEKSGFLAEVLVSPGYREALAANFDDSQESSVTQQTRFAEFVVGNVQSPEDLPKAAWKLQQAIALAALDGAIESYFVPALSTMEKEGPHDSPDPEMLPLPEPPVAKTNNTVYNMAKTSDNPIDYIDTALEYIHGRVVDQRKHGGTTRFVGPENYTTALKMFSDLYIAAPGREHLDKKGLADRVNDTLKGLEGSLKNDTLNFIEMTNVYATIRALPKGTIKQAYTPMILRQTLEELPRLHEPSTGRLLLSAFRKLDLRTSGETPGTILTLLLHDGFELETTRDFIFAMSAAANLPPALASTTAIRTIVQRSNGLEDKLDIDQSYELAQSLLCIVESVTDDLDVSFQARQIAERAHHFALRRLKVIEPDLDPKVLKRYHYTARATQQLIAQI